MKEIITLTIKKLMKNVKNFEKIKIVIAKIVTKTKIEITIIVKNDFYLRKYIRFVNVNTKTLYITIIIN